jgi:hypothetical protein
VAHVSPNGLPQNKHFKKQHTSTGVCAPVAATPSRSADVPLAPALAPGAFTRGGGCVKRSVWVSINHQEWCEVAPRGVFSREAVISHMSGVKSLGV